jgi:hypothetical protein
MSVTRSRLPGKSNLQTAQAAANPNRGVHRSSDRAHHECQTKGCEGFWIAEGRCIGSPTFTQGLREDSDTGENKQKAKKTDRLRDQKAARRALAELVKSQREARYQATGGPWSGASDTTHAADATRRR